MPTSKQVVVVRKDLRLRRAEVASYVARASSSFLLNNIGDGTPQQVPLSQEEAEWLCGGRKVIVLGVHTEDALRRVVDLAEIQGLTVSMLTKSTMDDKRGFDGTAVCAAIGPHDEESIDAVTGGLKLM